MKQELNKRMALGICICVFASFLMVVQIKWWCFIKHFNWDSIAIIAALGWGFEGCCSWIWFSND